MIQTAGITFEYRVVLDILMNRSERQIIIKTYSCVRMKTTGILPPFLPIEEIKKTVLQVLPDFIIETDTNFEKSDAEILVVTIFTPVNSELLDKFPNVKFIQGVGTGYNNVDLKEVQKRGIKFSNIPTANKEAVAEHVIAMTLNFLKDMKSLDAEIRAGNWPMITGSRELKGKTFGIIGMGAIGKRLSERLLPFEVEILYYDVARLSSSDEENFGVNYSELDDLLGQSDIISVHVPLNQKTRNMISAPQFNLMKDGAIFINTSRAEVVDDKALIDAIKSKGIKAGIDVYRQEPPDFSSEMFHLDGTLFSPHIAGVTIESQQRFITEAISNIFRYQQGLEPQFQVKE